jgi:hypothetical protein
MGDLEAGFVWCAVEKPAGFRGAVAFHDRTAIPRFHFFVRGNATRGCNSSLCLSLACTCSIEEAIAGSHALALARIVGLLRATSLDS